LGAVTVFMIITLAYLILEESADEDPIFVPIFTTIIISLVFLTLNFGRLSIKVDYHTVTVGYGIIKKRIPLENIKDCNIDETPAIKYGGAGIRTIKIKGEWILVFNVVGGPRVALSLRQGRYKKFVFSTKNPEEVINVIKGQLVLTK
jgi:hypothetical protein